MKIQKRVLSGLLAAAMAAGFTVTASAQAAEEEPKIKSFVDVSPWAWYVEAVDFCQRYGLMNGVSDETFDPEGTMTRGMLATVLYRTEGAPVVEADNPFTDVDPDSWYGPAVIWAAQQGLVEGYGNGTYGPGDHVTREQLATILWRYDGAIQPDRASGDYLDEADISHWASQAVDWSWDREIVPDRGDSWFMPKEEALRYELAVALMNYVLYRETDLVEPEEPSQPEAGVTEGIWAEFKSLMGYLPPKSEVQPNRYDMTQFSVCEQGYMTYAGGLAGSLGVDVSSHQEEIDWQQVAAFGVKFAIIRVGYRGYTMGTINPDTYFQKNIEGALAAGLKVGVYFFSQAITVEEALEEAQYTLQLIQGYPITFPVVFDWEEQDKDTSRTQGTDEDTIVACAIAFCETVKAAGYTPMFYASPSKAYKLDLGYLSGYPFWLAHYTKDMVPTSYTNHFDIWQYTSKGSVPGIEGNVDMNLCMQPW